MGTKCLYSEISRFHTYAHPPHKYQQQARHPVFSSYPFILLLPASCTFILYHTKYWNAVKYFWGKINEFSVSCEQGQGSQSTHSNQSDLTRGWDAAHKNFTPEWEQ